MSNYQHEVIELGDNASAMLYTANRLSWPNREGLYGEIHEGVEHFRGDRNWGIEPLLETPRPWAFDFGQETDGIGTKVKVNQLVSDYATAAFDLFAMACDDPAAKGYEPVVVTTDLNVNRLSEGLTPYVEQLARGAVLASRVARIAIIGGETAVLGDLVGGEGNPNSNLWFTWSAAVHAVRHRDRVVDGSKIEPGMSLVGFKEPGVRSNGITDIRTVFKESLGKNWHKQKIETEEGDVTLGRAVLRGSVIYTPVLVDAIGGYDTKKIAQAPVVGAAHITGGSIRAKLGELLAVSGHGAVIEEPFDPPEVMKHYLQLGGISDKKAYGKVHMGQGMIVATSEPDKLISVAAANNVEAKEIGTIVEKPGIRIRSAGLKAGKKIEFPAAA